MPSAPLPPLPPPPLANPPANYDATDPNEQQRFLSQANLLDVSREDRQVSSQWSCCLGAPIRSTDEGRICYDPTCCQL